MYTLEIIFKYVMKYAIVISSKYVILVTINKDFPKDSQDLCY